MPKQVTVKASELYARQNKLLHKGFVSAGMPYREHKGEWLDVASSLTKRKIAGLSLVNIVAQKAKSKGMLNYHG